MNNVLQRIKQVVDQQSDLPCIVSEGNSWSYGEMWENAARFAAYVTQQGIRKGDRIALVCDNSVSQLIAQLRKTLQESKSAPKYIKTI